MACRRRTFLSWSLLLGAGLPALLAGCGSAPVNEAGVVEGTAYLQGIAEIYPVLHRAPSSRLTLYLVPADEPDAQPVKSVTRDLGVVEPIPVRLKYRPSELDPERTWGVIATLETGGVVTHRTQAPFPAIVDGRARALALVLTPSRDH